MPRQHLKPFAWYGGKEALAPVLCSLLPVHEVYCEVFGGSGALLFAKAKSRLEVFNDLDGGVVNFFRVLRSAEQMEELVRLLTLTPYAYEEYYDCLKQWEATADPVERAMRSIGHLPHERRRELLYALFKPVHLKKHLCI